VNSPQESVKAQLTLLRVELVRLVLLDEIFSSRRICIRVEDFVQSGISLCFVEKVDELCGRHDTSL
jgi:hypothetical protein